MRVVQLLLMCLIVVVCMNSAGETLFVPGDYASIQAAIDAAVPGDVVEVAAGTYEENLVVKKNIELKGSGADNTIVRNASTRGEVLKVIDATGGSVSGFKFEHSDTASLDPCRKLFPDTVKINNSSIEFRNCTVSASAGCGVIINQGSDSRVVECLFEGNSQAGIFVRNAGTKATLLRNKCNNNEFGGICLTKGSKAIAEENICFNNNKWGALVLGKDTSIILKNNTFSFNRGAGVTIEKWAHGVVEDNTFRENEENGLLFKLGGNGSIAGNTFEKNSWSAVAVQSLAVKVDISNNTCVDNGRNGIVICYGADTDISGNTCKGNAWCGIVVNGWFTNAIVTDNDCSENIRHGILFSCSATGEAEANICRKNKLNGILVKDESTEADIGKNDCEDNGGEGVAHEEGDPISRQHQIESEEIGYAIAEEYFDEIETMASWLRQHKCRHSNGWWQLEWFYGGLKKGCGDISPENREEYAALIERWKKAYPESVTPLITLAEIHKACGWEARGSGYANTVTTEGWKIFHKELDIAKGYLFEAEALNGNDPNLYTLMIDVCKCLDYSNRKLMAMFNKGIEIDAAYHPLHHTMAWNLTYRWGGRPGELERFADKVYEITQKEYGAALYALIAGRLATCLQEEDYLQDHSFDQERIDKGYAELFEAFPESNYFVNQYCQLACYYSDQEKAKNLFDKIGGNMDEDVWWNRSRFTKWKQWAMAHAQQHRPSEKAPDSSSGALAFDALVDEATLLFENVSLAEGAMVFVVLFVALVFLLFSARKRKRRSSPLPKPPHADERKDDDTTSD